MICFGRVTDWPNVWALCESAFPRSERRSWAQHRRAMAAEPGFECVQVSRGGRVVALVFYWELQHGLFVEHLAVAPECRGQGIGRAVLQWLQQKGQPIILEIEPVVDSLTRRRLSFYSAAGFSELPYEHVQLPYHADSAAVPLRLLSWPIAMTENQVIIFEQELRERVMQYVDVAAD